MAHQISEYTRPLAPHGGFTLGDIKDDPSGTLVNRLMMTDPVQFWQTLMKQAGIVPNGADDTPSSSQLMDALKALVLGGFSGTPGAPWIAGGHLAFTTSGGSIDTSGIGMEVYNRYKIIGKTMYWQVQVRGAAIVPPITGLKIHTPAAIYTSGSNWMNIGAYMSSFRYFSGYDGNQHLTYLTLTDIAGQPTVSPYMDTISGSLDFDFSLVAELS